MSYIFGMVSETLEAIDSKTVSVFDRHCIKMNLLTNRTRHPGQRVHTNCSFEKFGSVSFGLAATLFGITLRHRQFGRKTARKAVTLLCLY